MPLTVSSCGLPQGPQGLNEQRLLELANRELMKDSVVVPGAVLETLQDSPRLIFVFKALRFGFVLFERGPSRYPYIGFGEVAGLSEDPIDVIQRAAAELAKEILSAGCDPTVELLVDRVTVYQVRGHKCSPLNPFSTSHSQSARMRKHTRGYPRRWRASHWTATSCQGTGTLFLCLPLRIASGECQVRISSSSVVG